MHQSLVDQQNTSLPACQRGSFAVAKSLWLPCAAVRRSLCLHAAGDFCRVRGPQKSHKPLINIHNIAVCESLLLEVAAHRFESHRVTSRSLCTNRNALTSRCRSGKWPAISLAYKDVMRSLRRAERESVPAGGGSSPPLPGGFGHHARRHYDRCVGCCHWTGTGDAG